MRGALLALPLLVGACAAGLEGDADLAEIQALTATRLALPVAEAPTVAALLERPLTADAAVRIALLASPRLQAAYAELGIARADLLQAGLLDNPVLSGDLRIGEGAVSPSLAVIQNLLSALTLPARRTIAAAAWERARLELAQRMLEVAAAARRGYYTVLADQQAAELLRQVVSATEAAAELAERQARAGNLSRRNQALQQAQYAQAALQLQRAEAQRGADREALNRVLGLSGDATVWSLPDRLPEIPGPPPPLEGLELAAIRNRLDLAGARQDLQTATWTLELAGQLRFLSVLGVGVAVERKSENGRWLAGPAIEISLPLFDQGQVRLRGLEAQRQRAERLVAALAVELRSEVREAWLRLSAAQETAAFHRDELLPLQQRIVAESQRLYNGMLIGVFELLRVRQDQINTARDMVDALRDYWLARADLERALAGPLPSSTGDGT